MSRPRTPKKKPAYTRSGGVALNNILQATNDNAIVIRNFQDTIFLKRGASVVSHAEVYNMICVSYAARYVDEQRGISGNA